jgi:hypothetical protein
MIAEAMLALWVLLLNTKERVLSLALCWYFMGSAFKVCSLIAYLVIIRYTKEGFMSFVSKISLITVPLVATLAGSAYAGGSIDLGINNTSASLDADATKLGSPLHVSAGGMYNEYGGDFVSAGLHVVDQRHQIESLYIGVGGKAFGYFTDDINSGALGLGGFARYSPSEFRGVGLYAHTYYAPQVLSESDTEGLIDIALRAEYNIIPNAKAFLGYRYVMANLKDKAKYDDRTLELSSAFHLGMRISF